MGPCHCGCGSSHLTAKWEGETKKDKGKWNEEVTSSNGFGSWRVDIYIMEVGACGEQKAGFENLCKG